MADIFIPPASGDTANGVDTAPGIPSAGGQRDPSLVTGQDPDSILGIPVSYESGSGGSPAPGGQTMESGDPTNQPNQYPDKEPISGVALGGSGAPGSQGITGSAQSTGATTIQVTDPNLQGAPADGQSGTQMQTVSLDVSGPGDSTATSGNYPPKIPIIDGNFYPEPAPGDSSHVKVGGFKNGQRDFEAPAEARADTFPGGDSAGVMPGPVAAARVQSVADPVNLSAAAGVDRPQPTDPGGTKNGPWAKTSDYPFTGGDSGPWRQT